MSFTGGERRRGKLAAAVGSPWFLSVDLDGDRKERI